MMRLFYTLTALLALALVQPVQALSNGRKNASAGDLSTPTYTVKFPGDFVSYECTAKPGGKLEFDNTGCGFLAINFDTLRFEAVGAGAACNQYQITYKVINWCEFQDGGTAAPRPTIIPRDIDQDHDLQEDTWLESGKDPWFISEFIYDRYSRTDHTRDGSGYKIGSNLEIVKIYGSDEDGKRQAFPKKVMVRYNCTPGYGHYGYGNKYSKPTYVGYLIYRLTDFTPKGGKPVYEEYCYKAPETLCANRYAVPCWTPGYYSYTRLVQIYDRVAPTVNVLSPSLRYCAYGNPQTSCDGGMALDFGAADDCTPKGITLRSVRLQLRRRSNWMNGEGTYYTITKTGENRWRLNGKFPVGLHRLSIQVTDACGNTGGTRVDFEIADCKAPAPICLGALSVDLMPVDTDGDGKVDGGANTVKAEAFIASDIDDCSRSAPAPRRVKYFILKDSELAEGPASIRLDSLTDRRLSARFTCADPDTVQLYVVALDGAGNFDYCPVKVFLRSGLDPDPCTPINPTLVSPAAGLQPALSLLPGHDYELSQNTPNPWQAETLIRFHLPQAGPASLTLYDLNGRVARVLEGEYEAGRQELRLSRGDLPHNGVWYYTLRAGSFTATRRMIVW